MGKICFGKFIFQMLSGLALNWCGLPWVLLVLFCLGCKHEQVSSGGAPNILLILTDDQGCGDVGFMGNEVLQTPNLNQLAADGVLFTRFYVAPVCAPTRASLMTGRYHQRTGVLGVIEGREFMVGEEKSMGEYLSEAGYTTGLVGKWHLGENYPWVPHAQGFDEFVGFRDGSHPYFDVMLEDKGRPLPTSGYLTDVLTDHAINFIEKNQQDPFFLFLSFNAPHSPYCG